MVILLFLGRNAHILLKPALKTCMYSIYFKVVNLAECQRGQSDLAESQSEDTQKYGQYMGDVETVDFSSFKSYNNPFRNHIFWDYSIREILEFKPLLGHRRCQSTFIHIEIYWYVT